MLDTMRVGTLAQWKSNGSITLWWPISGQDDPLALGMVDALAKVGIPAFGPDKKIAARIDRPCPKCSTQGPDANGLKYGITTASRT